MQSLIECIPEDTDYWKVIDQLKAKINDIVRDINTLKDNAENFSAINHYVESLVDYPGNLLDSLERKFVREGVCQWGIIKVIFFFLDLIILRDFGVAHVLSCSGGCVVFMMIFAFLSLLPVLFVVHGLMYLSWIT